MNRTVTTLNKKAMDSLISGFQDTLSAVSQVLAQSFGDEARWGVAGLNEGSLVFFLAETMRRDGWDARYEVPYRREGSAEWSGRHRSDIVANREGVTVLIEAKWWWDERWKLKDILELDAWKLAAASSQYQPVAVVFTIGGPDDSGWGNEQSVRDSLGKDVPDGWLSLGCAIVPSRYSVAKKGIDRRFEGYLAAAFFEKVR
jgi:hypothetical protein